jgi:hypothetical protein
MSYEFGTFTFGTTPKKVIEAATKGEDFTMVIRPRSEQEAVDRAFRRAKLRLSDWDGTNASIAPSEMYRFLGALSKDRDEEAWSLRSGILEVLGIEEI